MNSSTRNSYLKELGFSSIKAFQKEYMYRASGTADKETDNAIQTAINLKRYGKGHFSPKEFRCKCGGKYCNGFPAAVNAQLIKNIAYLREDSKSSMTISSGLRCKTWNAKQSGSASKSRHMLGKAVDIISAKLTDTTAKRNALIKRWYSFKKANYAYGNTSNMGKAVHLDVK